MGLVVIVWREPLQRLVKVALGGGFVGVLLLLRPDIDAPLFGAGLLALASGMCGGVAYFCIRGLGMAGEGVLRTVFYFALFGVVAAGLAAAVTGTSLALPAVAAPALLGLILFATAGQLMAARALHQGHSGLTAVFAYSGILFTLLIDVLVFQESFEIFALLGFALIVLSGSAALVALRTQTGTS